MALKVVFLAALITISQYEMVAGQTPGTDLFCVPAGTCIGGNGINPRIVTGGTTPAPAAACPAGFVPCTGSATATTCGIRHVTNVLSGDGTASYGAYPWQVFIRDAMGFTASGVLIDRFHVLTAAHKIMINNLSYQVHFGVHNPLNLMQAQNSTIKTIMFHPEYNNETLVHDIAVIRLTTPVVLGYQNNIGTACLPAAGTNSVGLRCQVSGWGTSTFTTNDAGKNTQRQVTLPVLSYTACKNAMLQPHVLGSNTNKYLNETSSLCAGGERDKDACRHDGGSPLVCLDAWNRFYVAGLVIWGVRCGEAGIPGVYVDIAKERKFIDETIALLNGGGGTITPRFN